MASGTNSPSWSFSKIHNKSQTDAGSQRLEPNGYRKDHVGRLIVGPSTGVVISEAMLSSATLAASRLNLQLKDSTPALQPKSKTINETQPTVEDIQEDATMSDAPTSNDITSLFNMPTYSSLEEAQINATTFLESVDDIDLNQAPPASSKPITEAALAYFNEMPLQSTQRATAKEISQDLARLGLPATRKKRDGKPFDLIAAILAHSDITHTFALMLKPGDLLKLFSVSKLFYFWVNMHLKTYVLGSTRLHCRDALKIFPPHAYKRHWIRDPAQRAGKGKGVTITTNSNALKQPQEIQLVPSLRYLSMVWTRDKMIEEINLILSLQGLRIPDHARATFKKIWFLMDIPSNAGRIAVIHNKDYFSNQDLILATTIFIKLDMCFMDPVDGNGETRFRKLMLGQRSLAMLLFVLRREKVLTYKDMMHLHLMYDYVPSKQCRGMEIFGVPADKIGALSREGWGQGTKTLLRPDELVMREGFRRKLNLTEKYFELMTWGFINPHTGQDVPVPDLHRILKLPKKNVDVEKKKAEAEEARMAAERIKQSRLDMLRRHLATLQQIPAQPGPIPQASAQAVSAQQLPLPLQPAYNVSAHPVSAQQSTGQLPLGQQLPSHHVTPYHLHAQSIPAQLFPGQMMPTSQAHFQQGPPHPAVQQATQPATVQLPPAQQDLATQMFLAVTRQAATESKPTNASSGNATSSHNTIG